MRKDATEAASQRRIQVLLFGVMLSIAVGNTGLQSVLPAVGRMIGFPDAYVALAFSLSALIWAFAAPVWAKHMQPRRARRMVLIGMGGFVASLLLCGAALSAGFLGWLSAGAAFVLFSIGRGLYGSLGAAAPPAAQAMLIAQVPRNQRTVAISLLASAFGLGTIIGPALAPFFVLPVVGLAGPPFIFGTAGLLMMATVRLMLPPGFETGRAVAVSDPVIGYEPTEPSLVERETDGTGVRVAMFDPRIRPWTVCGIASGHAQAISAQTMAFLIIDRLAESPQQAQPLIGMVLMCGAGAALLAQWGVIPRLRLQPPAMVLWGSIMAMLGTLGCAFAQDLHSLAIVFAIASLGFGFLRPGYTAGASLAVSEAEQAVVAGQVTASNGLAFVLGPSIGIGLYQFNQAAPYLVCAALMALMIPYLLRTIGRANDSRD
ncbi:MAG: MFS transporter [Sphingobium sp.]